MRNLAIENVAKKALNGILEKSITERCEYGGMIYMLDGKYHANDRRTQGYGNTVNVGQYEPNRGCPDARDGCCVLSYASQFLGRRHSDEIQRILG